MTPVADFLILALTLIGFGALSASMDRHAKQIAGAPPQPRVRRLRSAFGWGLLALALYPAINAYGVSIGIAVWIGFLAVAATAVVWLLSYRPGILRPLFTNTLVSVLVAAIALTILIWNP
jgi:hypothetical protein